MNKYCTLICLLFFSLATQAQTGTISPNCQDLNANLDANGDVSFVLSEVLTNAAAGASSAAVTITTTYDAVVYPRTVRSTNQAISFNACAYKDATLKINIENDHGACWSYLTFKQSNGPVLMGRVKDVYCFDPLVTGGHIDGTPPIATIPCVEDVEAEFVADWVTNYECIPPAAAAVVNNDTVKVIYREYEAFDKHGHRGFTFDTLVVFRLPGLDPNVNLYCAEKDTVYCGTGNAGPYILYEERCTTGMAGVDQDGDGVGCDTLYLLEWDDDLGRYVLNPFLDDTKCGVLSHLDYWDFGGTGCEEQSKYILELKQECIATTNTTCIHGQQDNAFMGTNGYFRCEFWVVDLDTTPPELYCKGEPLFYGPFGIDYWDVFAGAEILLGTAATIEDPQNSLDLTGMPHKFIANSVYSPTYKGEENVAANGAYPYNQDLQMDYEAGEDGSFDFSWKFDLGPLNLNGFNQAAALTIAYAQVAFYYEVDRDGDKKYYRILDGMEVQPDDLPGTAANVPYVLVGTSEAGRLSIPLKAGDHLSIRAFWSSPFNASLSLFGENIVSTSTHECAAHTYIPPLYVHDDWSGIKQAKAMIEGVGTFVLYYDAADSCWVSHDQVKLKKKEGPYKVVYEAYDSCHNVGYDSCYIFVKDLVKPVPVVDKGVTVSLSDKKVWVNAETFDEGSWDNCGINMMLVRRSDWYTACIDLCDSVTLACTGEHGDSLWVASLEYNKHRDEDSYHDDVEAHYAKTLDWLCEDETPCGELIYNAWQYDLMKYATLECVDHPYEVDAAYFRKHFEQCYLDFYAKHRTFGPQSHSQPFSYNESVWYDIDPGSATQLVFDRFKNMPNSRGHDVKRFYKSCDILQQEIDIYEQIGGGWSDAVPFSCEDACGPVTVEILVMDYWCNWAKAWTKVWVEDKTPVTVAKDVVKEETITCKTYKDKRYTYPDEIHPVALDYIVEKAKEGEQDAFDLLDEVFGGYQKAWMDPYGNYVDGEGTEIDCDITFNDSFCDCTTYYDQIRVYDEHVGYVWKDTLVTECFYDEEEIDFQHGVVVVNCEENVYCEQEVWCEFDHCGQGYIFRKFKIWQGCPDSFYVEHNVPDSLRHGTDTIYRHQRIWVGNECELTKYMFDVPGDEVVYSCNIEYDEAGNVIGDAGPENTGYATYKFDDDCRIVGIAHEDKVFKIVGGDAACYKIIRTWYFADWCGTGGTPVEGNWWYDYDLVVDSCVQKIIVNDTMPPVCAITVDAIDSTGVIEVGACAFNLSATVLAEDPCGLKSFYWELKDITDGASVTVDSDQGEISDTASSFDIESADLGHGSYKLKVLVVDECNNEGYCEYLFDVVSVKKPSPVCVTSVTATLTPWDSDQDGIVDSAHAVVWAGEFDSSSEPACQDTAVEFRIEFLDGSEDDETAAGDADSLVVGCSDVGSHLVRLWVVSLPSDTRDYCDVVLIVQSNGDECGGTIVGEPEPISEVTGMVDDTKDMDRSMLTSDQPKAVVGAGGRPLGQSFVHEGYILEQNMPNPFQAETAIGFVLPEAMKANVTVYDVTGRVIRTVDGNFTKGYNQVQFRKADLGVSGILYYRLNAGTFTATRKMIIID